MTSLPPLLPDSLRLPATDTLTGGPPAVPVPGAGGSDFADLVEGFTAPPRAAPPRAALPRAVLAGDAIPEAALADAPDITAELALPRAETSPATTLSAWPTGKTLPEPGALLPPALPPPSPTAAQPGAPGPGIGADAAALLRRLAGPPIAALADQADPAEPSQSLGAGQGASLAKSALGVPAKPGTAQALPDEDRPERQPEQSEDAALALTAEPLQPATLVAALAPATPPDPALLPQPAAAALTPASLPVPVPVPVHVPVPVTDGLAVTKGRAAATGRAVAQTAGAATPAARAAPTTPALPALPAARVVAPEADPALALAAEPGPAPGPGAGALADSFSSAAPAPAPAAANPAAALPMSERSADFRSPANAPAGPQLESAIAQVGDIREALRSARPAMTLQHAEFGAVSIRLEPAAPDQWRAVLASRDPGFVPAIQAALADRAVAAAADASSTFSGHSGTHQNGTSDQRYGSSPNGGQGSPQPYMGQSGSRDGEAAPDHRRPSTAAALAARGGSEAEDPAATMPGSGGLFA